ncbi:RHS repeat-associated core domain-containing protein [Fangia hongkongensis]|uniref:RHS repeat-associated core domain-containing protein n=1 Tax=Fangia hongkongensis TaxID=270495 RepID=UPI00035CE93A|nr:RHS repeat-associated core domain-containing protein [Fangia hongkongensis]MBK2124822.1 RHS repeat-associated core domain-containing protein [Fangia hongkongensis]
MRDHNLKQLLMGSAQVLKEKPLLKYSAVCILSVLLINRALASNISAIGSVKTVESISSYVYQYDANGNTTLVMKDNQKEYTYQYNVINQMSDMRDVLQNSSYHYAYYANGARSVKMAIDSGEEIHFYYGQRGKLLNESDVMNNTVDQTSSYFAGLRFVENKTNPLDSILIEPLGLRYNMPASLSVSSGVVSASSYHIEDYGRLDNTNANVSEGSGETKGLHFDGNPFIYGAGYYDSESGLNFQRARYYDPASGRFIAQDNKDLINRYNYDNANPVMNYDPSGHSALDTITHAMGTREGTNVMAGVGMLLSGISIMAAVPTGGSSILIAGEVLGFTSGLSTMIGQNISAGAMHDNKKWDLAAEIMGTASLAIGVGGIMSSIKNGYKIGLTFDDEVEAAMKRSTTMGTTVSENSTGGVRAVAVSEDQKTQGVTAIIETNINSDARTFQRVGEGSGMKVRVYKFKSAKIAHGFEASVTEQQLTGFRLPLSRQAKYRGFEVVQEQGQPALEGSVAEASAETDPLLASPLPESTSSNNTMQVNTDPQTEVDTGTEITPL